MSAFLDQLFDGKKGPPIEGSLGGGLYYAAIHNVEENRDYWGEFQGRMVTIAWGQGVMFGRATSPNDPNLERAYSDVIGYVAAGGGLSVDHNQVWYVPVLQYNWETREASFLVLEYIADVGSN